MHLTALVPGALVPNELSAELAAALQAPTLARLLNRANRGAQSTSLPGLADVAWIACEVYGGQPPAPTAPYAWAALTGSRDASLHVWHADPVHIAIGRDSLIVQDLAKAAPNDAESEALLAAANECLQPAGCVLLRASTQWFLHSDRAWAMTQPPLSAVLGQPLPMASAGTDDALRWSRLHNEIQMRWHADAVNRARDDQGVPLVNALWLHGGGAWSVRPPLRWRCLQSERVDLRGLAIAAGATVATADASVTGDTLLVWDDALASSRAGDWSHWLAAMQAIDRRLGTLPPSATLDLVLTGRRCARVWSTRPSDRFRLWRRTALAQALAE
jgi:hypothetical protein